LNRFHQAQLWIAGPLTIPPELEHFGTRVRRFPLMDWRGWFELVGKIDIALAPLEQNNLFSRAKSEIKFVEAGILGVPLVASNSDPFRDSITEGEDGLLVADEVGWTRALTSLIEQPERRARIGERAREIVLKRHSPAARTRDLAFLLPQLTPSTPSAIPTAPSSATTVRFMWSHIRQWPASVRSKFANMSGRISGRRSLTIIAGTVISKTPTARLQRFGRQSRI